MRVIDSHTEGEPTRLVIEGGPDLGSGSLAERRERFRREFDHVRSSIILEPRGHDALVGALLCEPVNKEAAAGVIFFNNTGYLGMCGHAAIGTAVTLHYMGRIGLGTHLLETPVGTVSVELSSRHQASVKNVESYRLVKSLSLDVPGLGRVTGDVAWGGNWFFLADASPLPLEFANWKALTQAAGLVQQALKDQGHRGSDGGEIDHIEFFGPAMGAGGHSRNFVLCPGEAYDRSPCGTGTSAKLACLAADGKLKPGEPWVQESIIGSRFEASYEPGPNGGVIPTITGRAYVCKEAVLIREAADPFKDGIS